VREDKAYFHQMNHIIPYMKVTTVQAKEIECGTSVSKWIGKNEAVLNNATYDGVNYGYPFPGEKCYSTALSQLYRTEPILDKGVNLTYSESDRAMLSAGRGLLMNYDGAGFTKVVKLNMSDEHYFRTMF